VQAVSDGINVENRCWIAEGDGEPSDNLQLLDWSASSTYWGEQKAIARKTFLLYMS
jgi:hypothetical protein